MAQAPHQPANASTIPTDGYEVLLAQNKAYRKGLDKMVTEGIMPGKMTKQGTIWSFGSWIYIVGMLPLSFTVFYVIGLQTGIVDSITYGWNSFVYDNPQAGKFAALLVTLGAVGFLAFMMFGPLIKLGIIPFKKADKATLDAEKDSLEKSFFELPMRTSSGYNTLLLIPICIILILTGLLLSSVNPMIGMPMIAVVLLVIFAWWFYQRATRPYFGFRHNGEVYARYPTSSWQLQLAQCKSVKMAYADSAYFNNWNQRPLARSLVKAVGATSLFPYKLVFELRTGEMKELVILNAQLSNKEYINTQEVELLVAQKLHYLGFHINMHYQDSNIAGWTATPKQ